MRKHSQTAEFVGRKRRYRQASTDPVLQPQYLQIMSLDNPVNVNKRYEHVQRLNPNETVGYGLRQVSLA